MMGLESIHMLKKAGGGEGVICKTDKLGGAKEEGGGVGRGGGGARCAAFYTAGAGLTRARSLTHRGGPRQDTHSKKAPITKKNGLLFSGNRGMSMLKIVPDFMYGSGLQDDESYFKLLQHLCILLQCTLLCDSPKPSTLNQGSGLRAGHRRRGRSLLSGSEGSEVSNALGGSPLY